MPLNLFARCMKSATKIRKFLRQFFIFFFSFGRCFRALQTGLNLMKELWNEFAGIEKWRDFEMTEFWAQNEQCI